MRFLRTTLLVLGACSCAGLGRAQLAVVSNGASQSCFGGTTCQVSVALHNGGSQPVACAAHTRLFQTATATAVELNISSWKHLQILPGQTILESASFAFPPVTAATQFVIQWWDRTNQLLGVTSVWAYPTNLLAELKPLAGDALGIYDPQNRLKPLLKNLNLDFANLETDGLDTFSGRLVIIGPAQPDRALPEDLAHQIKALAKKGTAVVWILPPGPLAAAPAAGLQPSFYAVPETTNAVVVAQPQLVAGLADNPQAQLNLLGLCRLAVHPRPPALPEWATTSQP
ncbi:MAG TPA: hypothetical protein VL527_04955 [Dongiaceae bacterium]|nr:hypothetical protein [Dongiaceae bacterium]